MLLLLHLWESQLPRLGQDLGPCGLSSCERKRSTAVAALCSWTRVQRQTEGWGCPCAVAVPISSLVCSALALLQHGEATSALLQRHRGGG